MAGWGAETTSTNTNDDWGVAVAAAPAAASTAEASAWDLSPALTTSTTTAAAPAPTNATDEWGPSATTSQTNTEAMSTPRREDSSRLELGPPPGFGPTPFDSPTSQSTRPPPEPRPQTFSSGPKRGNPVKLLDDGWYGGDAMPPLEHRNPPEEQQQEAQMSVAVVTEPASIPEPVFAAAPVTPQPAPVPEKVQPTLVQPQAESKPVISAPQTNGKPSTLVTSPGNDQFKEVLAILQDLRAKFGSFSTDMSTTLSTLANAVEKMQHAAPPTATTAGSTPQKTNTTTTTAPPFTSTPSTSATWSTTDLLTPPSTQVSPTTAAATPPKQRPIVDVPPVGEMDWGMGTAGGGAASTGW